MATSKLETGFVPLWSGDQATGTITLPSSWKNYRFLGIRITHYSYGSCVIFAKVVGETFSIVLQMVGLAEATTVQIITMSAELSYSNNVLTLGTQKACNLTTGANNLFDTTNMHISDIYGIN